MAWPQLAAARARRFLPGGAAALGESFAPFVGRLRAWAAAETGPGRLVPWLPVAFGLGVALYFSAEREPQAWAGPAVLVALSTAAVLLRGRAVAFSVLAVAACIAGGFSIITIKSLTIAHPILDRGFFGVELTGFVEVRETRERSDRVVLSVERMEARRLETPLQRVRVSVRKGTAPPVGSFVALKARLSPPLAPLRPGGYDFARDLYFQRIGASGFALGAIRNEAPPHPPPLRLRFAAFVSGVRDGIDARIRAVLPGDVGAIASALITGKRDALSAPVNDAMYVSSLGHVLSISGYHMAVVAGVVFVVIRGLLALSPGLALRRPIKKWAAAAALAAATAYLILSGAEVATQRSYLMTAVVLVGVMIDRAALTLRTLAIAAWIVLLIAPEAVVHPSFQMSFAATLALVAAYERGLPRLHSGRETRLSARIALWGGREILSLVVASLVAGLATTLYAAYHFHRLAPYGIVANLLAMPVVSVWVMPMGLIALAAAPFGFDGFLWQFMGAGVEWMIAVALWVASLPGAVGRVAAFGTGPLLLGTAGLIAFCLLRSPLRCLGPALVGVAILVATRTPRPDVLVAPDVEAVAVRAAGGRLAILKLGADAFATREWLAADADARTPGDPGLREGFVCDAGGCIARLADGRVVAAPFTAEAFEEDCWRAAVVVSRRAALPDCAALVIDRTASASHGAAALFRSGNGFQLVVARPGTADRPWSRGPITAGAAPSTPTTERSAPRDATPNPEDLRSDD